MKLDFKATFLWTAAALLLAAISAEVMMGSRRKAVVTHVRAGQLAVLLPASIPGIVAADEPIATTEEMKRAVTELLNYDDALFRIYRTPSAVVSIYIARWNAGKMAPRLVAAHTPDVCWPANGWKPGAMNEEARVSLGEALRKQRFAPGESRVFVGNDRQEYVVFWHKVGGDFVSYQSHGAPAQWAWLSELWKYGLALPQEQLFVRMSSNVPIEDIWKRAEFEPVRMALLDLGLRRESPQS